MGFDHRNAGGFPEASWISAAKHVGLSENSVPLNPIVNDHYPNKKWLYHWEY